MNKAITHSYGEDSPITVSNMLVDDNGEMSSLILTEVPEKETLHFLEEYKDYCDMICGVFDVSDTSSFKWLKEVIKRVENGRKILLIGSKTDMIDTVCLYSMM